MSLIYIAGPMTGLPEHNIPEFDRVAGLLKEQGYSVLNPADVAREFPDKNHAFYMRKSLERLLEADAIFILNGWSESVGAKLEVKNAIAMGLPIMRTKDLEGTQ